MQAAWASFVRFVDVHGIVAGCILGLTFFFGSMGAVLFGLNGSVVLSILFGVVAGIAFTLGLAMTVHDNRRLEADRVLHRERIRAIRQGDMQAARAVTRIARDEDVAYIGARLRSVV